MKIPTFDLKIDPFDFSSLLVGSFLRSWAYMENELISAIAVGMTLSDLQSYILKGNTQFRDKIHILGTLVDCLYADELLAKQHKKVLTDLAEFSTVRNMMAHEMFGPLSDWKPGVQFLTVKAKGKLSFPDNVWDMDKYSKEHARVDKFAEFLVHVRKTLAQSSKLTLFAELPATREEPEQPTSMALEQVLADHPNHSVQGTLDLNRAQTSSEKVDQTTPAKES
jgi:hypothetical protein